VLMSTSKKMMHCQFNMYWRQRPEAAIAAEMLVVSVIIQGEAVMVRMTGHGRNGRQDRLGRAPCAVHD
jgi:hypothetical protein